MKVVNMVLLTEKHTDALSKYCNIHCKHVYQEYLYFSYPIGTSSSSGDSSASGKSYINIRVIQVSLTQIISYITNTILFVML